MDRKPMLISIEGNIGSGKSTMMNHLKQNYKIRGYTVGFIDEPVEIWNSFTDDNTGENIIEKYYKDHAKYAFSFQMMAYISRLSTIKKALKSNCDILLTERSIYTDRNVFAKMLYDSGKIEDINYKIYLKWFDEFLDDIKDIKIVYLKTDPETASNRVIKRNRKGETIPLEYLSKCNDYHDTWINSIADNERLVINGDVDNCDDEYYTEIAEQITEFIMTFMDTNKLNSSLVQEY